MRFRVGCAVVVTLSAAAACAAPRHLSSSDSFVAESHFTDSAIDWEFRQRRPVLDSVDRTVSGLRTAEHLVHGDSSHMITVMEWRAPFSSTDSLIVARSTLRPVEESSVSPTFRFRYRYRGARVTGMIQRGDSSAHEVDVTYEEPVFAFNQLDQLVRSLQYHPGHSVVVPLFSEMDADLEHDTLTVVTDTVVSGNRAWVIRFADPVVVKRYIVDAASRQIIEAETRQRRSGLIFRLVREGKVG